MPRLREIPRSEATAPIVLSMYDRLFGDRDPGRRAGHRDGHARRLVDGVRQLARRARARVPRLRPLRQPRPQDRAELRELGQTRAGWLVGSQFVFSQHCKSCRALGYSEEKIEALKAWQVSDLFSPLERALLAYTDALVLGFGRVDDAVFDAMQAHLSDEAILEFTYITMMYTMHAVISRALHLEYDERDDPIVEIAAPDRLPGRRHRPPDRLSTRSRDRVSAARPADRACACWSSATSSPARSPGSCSATTAPT